MKIILSYIWEDVVSKETTWRWLPKMVSLTNVCHNLPQGSTRLHSHQYEI